ncbi:LCP family protein [Fodinisporobacter ferrooxydans]|uniref:LCP family protein n=1 Tax=Fodinisporobacter ferrooxydans TaxID=2901836 RepID=A0ABY4CIA5_9BACL|nr:LCP family protein [Alicyclobacillaceae bacterium MYW30-H2]
MDKIICPFLILPETCRKTHQPGIEMNGSSEWNDFLRGVTRLKEASRLERARAKRRRRRRRRLLTFAGIFAAAGILAAVADWYLQPQRHFQQVPIVGRPDTITQTDTPTQMDRPTFPKETSPSLSDNALQNSNLQNNKIQKDDAKSASFNVLILGIDARAGEQAARTDVIMVAHVNPKDTSIHLVSIPRDTRVYLPGIGETKINHAHFVGNLRGGNHAGTKMAIQAVSDFLHIPINYYAKMNFQGFQRFIDQIGGVDVTFSRTVGIFKAGTHHLNGEQTLMAVRERYSLPNGDFGRQFDQSLVLRSILRQMLRLDNIPKLPAEIKEIRADVIDTNFTYSDLLSFALLYKGLDNSHIQYEQIPGHNGVAMDPLVGAELDYWIPDRNAVQKISHTFLQDH